MIPDFLVPFVTIGLAELGDKTQLSIFLLSSGTEKRFQLLLGVSLAFLTVDGFAVALGSWITHTIPYSTLKVASGLMFLAFGFLTLMGWKIGKKPWVITVNSKKNPLIVGYTLIFMAEWGDKTQVASALFAAHFEASMVLLSVMAALIILSAIAIYLGKIALRKVDNRLMMKVSGILFMIIGFLTFFF
ncbi:MAG: TMEM165/GDT1 family protein [Candidatus Bathyarchaeia archaeon]